MVETVETKVKSIIAEWGGFKPGDIALESDLKEDLGMDSLDTVELNLSMEDAFDIEIPDDDAVNLRTVKQIIDYIESKVNKS